MVKMLLRWLMYFLVFLVCDAIFAGVHGDMPAHLLMALILTAANLIIRPVVLFIGLPLNLLTFGIASIFANMLMLLIADAVIGSAGINGFWLLALVSVIIMGVDTLVRTVWDNKEKTSEA